MMPVDSAQIPVANIGQQIGDFIVGVLAVAGAGLVGYLFTATILWLVIRVGLRCRLPKSVAKTCQVTGGVALALLIAWMAFFGTGGGFGWGGGWGFGGQGGASGVSVDPSETKTTEAANSSVPPPSQTASSVTTASASAPPLAILLLGGDRVRGNAEDDLTFYQILPDGDVMGFRQIKTALQQRKLEQPPLREIILVIRHDSVAHNHPAVRRLEDWAKDEGLTVNRRVTD